ncbi:NAD(P)/FAD-dependent oxidoreductase [bacterium]|nr:NAD(P)/FAD-dependent oxidoreductase [bacterium]
MPLYDIIIIGAGPAGLFTALQAATNTTRILILEKQSSPGQKLLLSGSGQCNFTNNRPLTDFLSAYGDHGRFLKPALYHFSNQAIIHFFKHNGILPDVVEKNGKVFPQSRKARDILNILIQQCKMSNITIHFNQNVKHLHRHTSNKFSISTPTKSYHADQIVITTGGQSYPATGSTGDGYALAQSFGHHVVPPKPGLTSFILRNHPLADLAGTSFQDLPLSLWHAGKKTKSLTGDMVITHQGLSGPVVHNLSRYARSGDTVCLSFLGTKNPEVYKPEWLAEIQQKGSLKIRQWFSQYAPTQALGNKMLLLAKINPDLLLAQLSRIKQNELFRYLSAFPLKIKNLGDFSTAMVTCGGICLDEVNPKTMASRLVKGLFFAGEVLDIDGDSGGYDLQAAWSTGALAAHGLKIRAR